LLVILLIYKHSFGEKDDSADISNTGPSLRPKSYGDIIRDKQLPACPCTPLICDDDKTATRYTLHSRPERGWGEILLSRGLLTIEAFTPGDRHLELEEKRGGYKVRVGGDGNTESNRGIPPGQ
jgi:hypothetical protein